MGQHQEAGKELEEIRSEVSRLRSELGAISAALKGAGGSAESSSGNGHWSFDKVRGAWEGARERGRQSAAAVSHRVEERPLAAVFTMLGAGVLLGSLFGLIPWGVRRARREEAPTKKIAGWVGRLARQA